MSLILYRDKFQSGQLSKENYIETMGNLHAYLFEYTRFIKNTDIAKIEIHEDYLVFTLKNIDIRIQCYFLDKRMTPIEILNFSSYEKQDADIFFSLFENDMVFFDIGAHIGFYSMAVAKLNKTIKIYSFEPIPQTFELLNNNILINEFNNVYSFNIGLLNKNKKVIFFLNPTMSGNASAENIAESVDIEQVSVNVTLLDDFFCKLQLDKLDVIKCDVEGSELLVLQGGIKSITQHTPILFIEMLRKWSKKFNYHPNDIIQLLTNLGYRCFISKNKKLIEFFSMNEETVTTNFFFLHRNKHQKQIQRLMVN
ncbi:MAG: hypothetical protein RLY40_1092 [Pseudomonadota bacterium]|jgi:FkbM family methyltransferase